MVLQSAVETLITRMSNLGIWLEPSSHCHVVRMLYCMQDWILLWWIVQAGGWLICRGLLPVDFFALHMRASWNCIPLHLCLGPCKIQRDECFAGSLPPVHVEAWEADGAAGPVPLVRLSYAVLSATVSAETLDGQQFPTARA